MERNSSSAATCGGPSIPCPSQVDPGPATRASSRAPRFRTDGTGYLDAGRRSRLFFVTLRDEPGKHGVSRPIGQGRLSDQDAVWSPDGARVFFTAETAAEPDYAPPHVVLMEATSVAGPLKEVAAVDGAISRPAPSPDGTRVAFIASLNGRPVRSYSQADLFVVDRATGTVTNLTEQYDYDIGGGLAGDQRAPRASSATRPIWTRRRHGDRHAGRCGRPREPGAHRRGHGRGLLDHRGRPRGAGIHGDQRGTGGAAVGGAGAHRRPSSGTSRWARLVPGGRGAQRRPDEVARPCRARDVLDAIV